MKRELEEIEVDITAPAPLNKKQKRLLKKGKIEEPKPIDPNAAANRPKPRSPYSVWIGNLSFETTANGLRDFLVEKTEGLSTPVTAEDITRLKLPPRKGFAYVDVKTEDQMNTLIKLSESRLDGRNLLIKAGNSFEGRPEEHANGQKNPPSRVLFVGNLSFDTTDEQLEQQFQHCGEIRRIRTATFQDTGKCKGFTFIDFKTEEAATNAIKDKSCHKMNGRTLRLEYGEDRSQRRPKQKAAESGVGTGTADETKGTAPRTHTDSSSSFSGSNAASNAASRERRRETKPARSASSYRPTPGEALKNAPRAKQTIVPSQGKKVVF